MIQVTCLRFTMILRDDDIVGVFRGIHLCLTRLEPLLMGRFWP